MDDDDDDDDDLVGTVIDRRFRVLGRLGAGGMGTVYLAQVEGHERRVAIKVLHRKLGTSREHVERFIREARAAHRSAHPNVIELIDAGYLPGGAVYHAMELLDGEDLANTLRAETRLPWPRVRHIALQLCAALAHAHGRDIVHRDLKPANCFRITRGDDPDFIKVLDFGVAKLLDGSYETLTREGVPVGTLRYMAPEQAEGGEIDHRVDIYALGAMLYHLLTGRTAAAGRSSVEVLTALLTRPPEPFSVVAPDLDLPASVWPIVQRAMARDPAQRFASMRELADAIAAVPTATPTALPMTPTLDPVSPAPAPANTRVIPRKRPGRAILLTLLLAAAVVMVLLAPWAFDRPAEITASTITVPEDRIPSSHISVPPPPDLVIAPVAAPPPEPAPVPEQAAQTSAPAPSPPTPPTRANTLKRARKLVRGNCPVSLPETVQINFHVADSGALRTIEVLPPHNIGRLATCIKSLLASLRFPAGLGDGHIERWVVELDSNP